MSWRQRFNKAASRSDDESADLRCDMNEPRADDGCQAFLTLGKYVRWRQLSLGLHLQAPSYASRKQGRSSRPCGQSEGSGCKTVALIGRVPEADEKEVGTSPTRLHTVNLSHHQQTAGETGPSQWC